VNSQPTEPPIAQLIGWRWHSRMRAYVPPDLDAAPADLLKDWADATEWTHAYYGPVSGYVGGMKAERHRRAEKALIEVVRAVVRSTSGARSAAPSTEPAP
jgi:hypothetical protein